jgi:hypothetical protein
MANNFKKVLDRQMWVQVAPATNAHAAGGSFAVDLRNDISRNPFVYQLASATVLNRYNIVSKSWNFIQSPALAGTFGAGSGAVFAPSLGLKGSITTGCSTTKIVTSTTITNVGVNMLANRGGSGDYGFKIRIIGNSAGGAGKIEERHIIANTSGTTPTLWLNEALSFTPASGDTYEIIAGRVFLLNAGTLASQSFKSIEVAANTLTTLTQTNLPATVGTDFSGLALDEQYVPYDAKPGEGFITGAGTYDVAGTGTSKACLVATDSADSSLTGQSSGGDSAVLANEYRNFQIRIVEDTAIPTAVNQRCIIASHTPGASPVYTLGAAWSVTPSATAKFVIEYPNILWMRSSATTSVYTYNYSGRTINNGTNSINNDAVSTTYFGVSANAMAAGCVSFPSFGIRPDNAKNSRHSYIYQFRGGASSTIDVFDIAGGTTGSWTAAIVYDGAVNLTTGSCGNYAPAASEGRFGYLDSYVASATNQIYRFDVKNRVLSSFTPTDWVQSGTAAAGNRIACFAAIDGTDKYNMVLLLAHTSTIAQEIIEQF